MFMSCKVLDNRATFVRVDALPRLAAYVIACQSPGLFPSRVLLRVVCSASLCNNDGDSRSRWLAALLSEQTVRQEIKRRYSLISRPSTVASEAELVIPVAGMHALSHPKPASVRDMVAGVVARNMSVVLS